MNDIPATTPNPIKRLRTLLKELHSTVTERAMTEEVSQAEHKRICAEENERYQKISGKESSRHQSAVRSAEADRERVNREVKAQTDQIQSAIGATESFLGTVGRKSLVGSSSQQRAVLNGIGDMPAPPSGNSVCRESAATDQSTGLLEILQRGKCVAHALGSYRILVTGHHILPCRAIPWLLDGIMVLDDWPLRTHS